MMKLGLIFEYILKQLQHFSSCLVFGTYPGFETITRIHINVNFQTFTHFSQKIRFLSGKILTNRKQKTLFFNNFNLKKSMSNIFCSYNIDITRNPGNCLFKMREIKSTLFLFNKFYREIKILEIIYQLI